jgi:hypothetical protein
MTVQTKHPGYRNQNIAELVAMLVKKPRTVEELMPLTHMTERTLRAWLRAFIDEGLLRVDRPRNGAPGVSPAVYHWKPIWERNEK